jgi:hypothetical protein
VRFQRESTKVKIIKIIKSCRNASEEEIKSFLYKNLSQELISGLEYDDPKTISRVLKMFGIDPQKQHEEGKHDKTQHVTDSFVKKN